MLCEMCKQKAVLGYWTQTRPVERMLCRECADKDMRATFPKMWEGRFEPAIDGQKPAPAKD